MASPAIGSIGFAFEPTATPGEQDGFFLAYGAVAATSSAANQPTGSSGMRAHILVYNNTATGTVTITGKDISGNALAETTPTIPIYPLNALTNEQGRFDYVTAGVFGSINANGITTTGLTGGNIKINAIVGAKILMPATAKITPKYGLFSPEEHRALPDLNTHKIQTVKDVDIELDTTLYPDNGVWLPYAMLNSVTNPSTLVSLPGSPTSLLASSAVSGSPLSLTTQPTSPGMRLIAVITGTSVKGTIAFTGVSIFGDAITETIQASGNGTYYSSYTYQSINASGVVTTGLTSGSIAITGVYAWNRSFFPSLNPFTLTTEWYTGTDSVVIPYCAFSEFSLEFDAEKEFKVLAKGIGQDYAQIGSRATNPMSTSQVVNLAQPLDYPLAAWDSQVFIDPVTGTSGTTVFGDMMSGKITVKNPMKPIHKMTSRQTLSVIYRKKISVEFDAKIDYTNLLQAEQFRSDLKQLIQFNFYGRNVGGGNLQTVQFIIPFKYTKFDVTSQPNGDQVIADIAGIGEYDPGIGASYQINWNGSSAPPNFTS